MRVPRTFALQLLVLLLAASAAAQGTGRRHDVGWFEFRDPKSRATGLGTVLRLMADEERRANRELRLQTLDLRAGGALPLESLDMIVLGSFSDDHPDWNAFVQREGRRVLDWVRGGGILVQMARRRDDPDEPRRLRLLPDGYWTKQGSHDAEEYHCSKELFPMWEGIHDRLKEEGGGSRGAAPTKVNPSWYRRPAGKFGALRQSALDAFEEWSDQFEKSAGEEMDIRERDCFALHASHGRGTIVLYQLAIDKYDGAEDFAKNLSTTFFGCLLRWARSRPNPDKRLAVEPKPIEPKPIDPKPIDPQPIDPKARAPKPIPEPVPEPTPPALPRTYRVEGRLFLDENDNGNRDQGEEPVAARLRFRGNEVPVDAEGRFSVTIPRDQAGFLDLVAESPLQPQMPWFFYLPAGYEDPKPLTLDMPFRLALEDVERTIAVTLPRGLADPVVADAVTARLGDIARKEGASRVILFSGAVDDTEIKAFRERLEILLLGSRDLQVYPVLDPALKLPEGVAPRDFAFSHSGCHFQAGRAPAGTPGAGLRPVLLENDPGRVLSNGPEQRMVLAPAGAGSPEAAQARAPVLLDPRDLGAPSAYLVFEFFQESGELAMRAVPEPAAPKPALAPHPWGRGDLRKLLDVAGRPEGR